MASQGWWSRPKWVVGLREGPWVTYDGKRRGGEMGVLMSKVWGLWSIGRLILWRDFSSFWLLLLQENRIWESVLTWTPSKDRFWKDLCKNLGVHELFQPWFLCEIDLPYDSCWSLATLHTWAPP